jgi:hypothetical protein
MKRFRSPEPKPFRTSALARRELLSLGESATGAARPNPGCPCLPRTWLASIAFHPNPGLHSIRLLRPTRSNTFRKVRRSVAEPSAAERWSC